MKVTNKQCFRCKKKKALSSFDIDNRKYQLTADMNTCKVCKQCEVERGLKDLSTCKFNYDTNKFEVIKFTSKEEAIIYFKKRYFDI